MAEAEASTTPGDYWKKITECRDNIMALLKEPQQWLEAKTSGDIQISYMQTDKGRMWHFETDLDVSPETGRRYVIPVAQGGLREKFRMLRSPYKEVKVIEDNARDGKTYFILHEIMYGSLILTERDMINVYGGEDNSEIGAYMVHYSINHPNYPPHRKRVRMTTHFSGQFFFSVINNPNKCVFHSVSLVDNGGKLPVFLLNRFMPAGIHHYVIDLKLAIANKLHENY